MGLLLCASILAVTVVEKFAEGGWLTLLVTSSVVAFASSSSDITPACGPKSASSTTSSARCPGEESEGEEPVDPKQPVAALLVSGYGGLGIHSLLSIHRTYPGFYKDMVFLSVGAVDSGHFKGKDEMEALEARTVENLERYAESARGFGFRAAYRYAVGTDVLDEAEALCREVAARYPRATFYVGKLIFRKEAVYHRLLHNDTAYAIQRRLQFAGLTTVILPIRMEIT